MAFQEIDLGTSPNAGDGDALRDGGDKINDNFNEVYGLFVDPLTALMGLAAAADKLAYYTSSSTAALADFTSIGRSIVGAADAAAVRSAIGLVIGTNVLAYHANPAALSGLTLAADNLIYATGAGALAQSSLTAFSRTVLDDTTAGAWLTTLGISAFIQTVLDDVDAATARATLGAQGSDAELSALAGLTSAADKLAYFTGSGTAALADFTSFGRSLVDDANAAAARTTLGLGTSAVIDTGTSGTKVVLLDGANTWSATQSHATGTEIDLHNQVDQVTNYERLEIKWSANVATIATTKGGSGISRAMMIGNVGNTTLSLMTGGTARVNVGAFGTDLSPNFDNQISLGGASARYTNLFMSSYQEMSEQAAPSAPAADRVRIYAVDNGSGKTQLMALFSSGAAQQLAIQP